MKPDAEVSTKTCVTRARERTPMCMCPDCGEDWGRDLHHISEDQRDNRPENLVRLCRSCHRKRHAATRAPKVNENTKCLMVWVTPEVHTDIKLRAMSADVTVSHWLRRILLRELAKRPRRVVRGAGDGEARTP